MLLLQHVGFHLQEQPTLSRRCLFNMSNIFKNILYDQPPPKDVDVYLIVMNNQTIWRIANAWTIEKWNKWENASNIKGQILAVTLPPFLGLGAIVSLEIVLEYNKIFYQITMGMFWVCTYPDFMSMVVSAIASREQYTNCKHLYYLYWYFYKIDIHNDKFIHAPSYSFNEVKLLIVESGIITISE